MRINFRLVESYIPLLERTYTVGDTQYWKRNGKYFSWTEGEGKKEIGQDEYFKALSGGKDEPPKVKREPPKISSYKDASDEDLAVLASSGDTKATDSIIRRYEPLVHKLSNKYFLTGGDRDDLVQHGLIGMWDAIKTYDPDRNGNFSKYIGMAIDKRLQYAITADNSQANQMNNYATSFDEPTKAGGDSDSRTYGDVISSREQTPEERYLGKEGATKLMDFMKNELAPKERDVIFRFINGNTINNIAKDMDISYKSVENALMRARNKIRDFKSKNESKKLKGISVREHKVIEGLLYKLSKA